MIRPVDSVELLEKTLYNAEYYGTTHYITFLALAQHQNGDELSVQIVERPGLRI